MLLRKDDPWNRELDHPDIRNWRVIDAEDRVIGFVESVVINRQENRLVALLTGANERFPIADAHIEERIVRLKDSLDRPEAHTTLKKSTSTTYEDAFRSHFQEALSDSEDSYDTFKHAYNFGRQMALDADFSGLKYARAREALRGHWVSRNQSPAFERVEAAVRYAYQLVRGIEPYRMTGMEREEAQILGRSGRKEGGSESAGAHMATGRPRSSSKDGAQPRSTA